METPPLTEARPGLSIACLGLEIAQSGTDAVGGGSAGSTVAPQTQSQRSRAWYRSYVSSSNAMRRTSSTFVGVVRIVWIATSAARSGGYP